MWLLGPLGFASPWLLAALAALPALWLILRAMPPAPRRLAFPGVALLLGLRDRSPVAQRTPWWLLLLRILAVAALILGFAGPVWKPAVQPGGGDGPLLVVLDAGWAAAPGWPVRLTRAEAALDQAAAAGRPAALLIGDGRAAGGFQSAADLLPALRAARPAAWETRYPDTAFDAAPEGRLDTLWLSDGLDHPGRADLLADLAARGVVRVVPPATQPLALELPADADAEVDAALRLYGAADPAPAILAIGPDPQGIERSLARLPPGPADANGARPVPLDLPPELRNRIRRFEIEGLAHAGAVVLADDRTRRHKVGLVGDADEAGEGQRLLSPLYYLRRALAPSADLVEGGLGDVLDAAPDVVILVDQVDLPEADRLSQWVEAGGLLIRFAGPRMAGFDALAEDDLLPVRLRPGGRDIGGALSWGDPRGLTPFDEAGPFAGLAAPDEVEIRAQLMAQPAPDLADRVIAALSDNTPLITRAPRGEGQLVLVHVTANAEWSNWPLSGLFVQMLDRLVASAGLAPRDAGAPDEAPDFWVPQTVLDGFGRAGAADDLAPVAAVDFVHGPGPGQPAGLYAAGERVAALNAGGPLVSADWPGATVMQDEGASGRSLKGPLIALAALLLALDAAGSALLLRGGRVAAALLIAALAVPGAGPAPARAQPQEAPLSPDLIRAANEVALGYVVTGDAAVDRTSEQGLRGLSQVLAARTSVEPGAPVAIDPDRDELAVLSFLYWPVTDDQPPPSPQGYLRLNHFLRAGGMILFDTRDGDLAGLGGPDSAQALQRLAAPLDIPPLAPVPQDHVLRRSFYLLHGFPGRWDGRPVWIEAPPVGAEAAGEAPFRQLNDGVSPVVIGGHSWAEAWALDQDGMAVFPVGRGWQGEEQREMAYRFGVNLIIHVLTGNYKSDQVHVPALLDRLRAEDEGGR